MLRPFQWMLLLLAAWSLSAKAAGSVAAAAAAAAPPRPGATCTLVMRGGGAKNAAPNKPPSLRLACIGGPVLAAVNASALGLAPNAAFPGVALDPFGCGGAAAACLVTLCGGAARVTIRDAVIAGVALAPLSTASAFTDMGASRSNNMHALCVRGAAHVALVGGTFTGNRNVSALAVNDTATLRISGGAVFADNEGLTAPLVASGNATLTVAGGARFTGNRVGANVVGDAGGGGFAYRGGGLYAHGNAKLHLRGPITFTNNTAQYGAAIALYGAVKASIAGPDCLIADNNATWGSSGGILMYGKQTPLGEADVGLLSVDGCQFRNNSASRGIDGGAFAMVGAARARLANSAFDGNAASAGGATGARCEFGGGRCSSGLRPQLGLVNVTLRGNAATWGGALVSDSSDVKIVNCTFADNTAHAEGALHFKGSSTARLAGSNVVARNRIAGEAAGMAELTQQANNMFGAGMSVQASNVTISGRCLVEGNWIALDGASGAGIGVRNRGSLTAGPGLRVRNNTATGAGAGVVVRTGSEARLAGAVIESNMGALSGGGLYVQDNSTAALVDCTLANNQAVSSGAGAFITDTAVLNMTRCSVANNTVTYGGGAGIFLDDEATVRLEDTQFSGNIGTKGADVAAGPLAKLLFLEGNSIGPSSRTVWQARTVCLVGEVRAAGGYCARCGANLFSVLRNATACQLCPARAACPGGDVIEPLRGSWHSHPYSALVHECPNPAACSCAPKQDAPSACAGSPCAEGYTGNVCGACADGFASTGQFKCGKCLPTAVLVPLYLMSIAAVLALMAYSAAAAWSDNLEFAADANAGSRPPARPADALSVLILFLQYLAIVSAIPVPWPASFRGALAGVTWLFAAVSGGGALSLDCLLAGRSGAVPLPVARALMHLAVPAAMALLLMTAFALPWRRLRRRRRSTQAAAGGDRMDAGWSGGADACDEDIGDLAPAGVLLWRKLCVVAMTAVFYFYPSIIKTALSFFACLPLDRASASDPFAAATAPHGYWADDIQQPCWQGWHRAWALALGLPVLLVFCAGIPLGVAAALWANRGELDAARTRHHLGSLYRAWRPELYWWNALVMAETAALSAIAVFRYNLGALYSALLLFFALALCLALHLQFMPYASRTLNLLQAGATASLLATVYAGTALIISETLDVRRREIVSTPLQEAMGALALAASGAFAIVCVCVMVALGGRRRRRKLSLSAAGKEGALLPGASERAL